ncbi:MAG: hypothetical protein ABSG13_25345 [Bryobacteraceae bacterium]
MNLTRQPSALIFLSTQEARRQGSNLLMILRRGGFQPLAFSKRCLVRPWGSV